MANSISRANASSLMPEDAQREIVQGVTQNSACLRLMRRLPNMVNAQRRMPVLSVLPTATFLTAELTPVTGSYKTPTNVAWANKYIDAEEIACIVPIHENVLDDADYDIWGEVRPLVLEAMGIAIDKAILWGTNAPASWPKNILHGCYLSQNVNIISILGDIVEDIGGKKDGTGGGIMSLVEDSGFRVSGFISDVAMEARLRGLRDTGNLLYQQAVTAGTPSTIYGQPSEFMNSGMWDSIGATIGDQAGESGGAHMICGDFSQAVFSIRKDVTWKILTEATIHDPTDSTTVLYNLAQQDMVALRVVMRLGWQVPNPINRLKATEYDWDADDGTPVSGRYPFAALTAAVLT